MRVLIACESSGVVRRAFRARGHDAWSCDLLPADDRSSYHIQDDVLSHLSDGWDLMIAHPPCTYLSNAGARWLYPKGELNEERYRLGQQAKRFFYRLLLAPIARTCVENPKSSLIFKLPPYSQVIHPYQFGDPYSKRTQLWLRSLPPLRPTKIVKIKGYWCGSFTSRFKGDKKKSVFGKTQKDRSRTFEGIAKAMASQWGDLCVS